jgi:dephospho-CoA kinase
MRVARVVSERGIDPDDVRARMAAQASSEQREALADVIIRNNGSREDLRVQVDSLWEQLRARLGARA